MHGFIFVREEMQALTRVENYVLRSNQSDTQISHFIDTSIPAVFTDGEFG